MSIFGQPATAKPTQPSADLTYYIFIGVILFILILLAMLSAWLYIDSIDIKIGLNTFIDNIPILNLLHINLNGHYYVFSNKLELILNVSTVISATITTVIISLLYFDESNSLASEIHIAGRKLLSNNNAIKMFIKNMTAEKKWGLSGLALIQTTDNQKLEISQDRETRHILICGSIGGGKTTVMRNYIDEAIKRKDKCLILDNKSDFLKTLKNDFVLIAPWDARGAAWDVAADIRTKSDAKALAAETIAESDDPIWSNGARALLTAMIVRAQTESAGNWDFGFITEIMSRGDREIKKTVERYTPEFTVIIEDVESKTTKSLLVTLVSFLDMFFVLTDAYSRCQTTEKFSFRKWLLDDSDSTTVVLQGNGSHEELQKNLGQAIFGYITRTITSPEVTDVRADKRRIQLFCDEFPQFGKIDTFGTLVEVGRSKGVRIVLGVQDISQIRKIYGQDTTQTWLSSLGTYVICRLNGLETAEYFSKIFGNKRVKTYQPSVSLSQQPNAGGFQRTDQWVEQELPVFRSDEFARLLNVNEKGAQVAVFTSDDYVYLIRAKHLSESQKHERRAATEPARWTQVGWPSAKDLIIAKEKNENQKKESFNETLDEITS